MLDADATVTLSIDPCSEATSDVDYRTLFRPTLEIRQGEVTGSTRLLINTIYDDDAEGNPTITLNGAIEGLASCTGLITIADVAMMDDVMMDPLAFTEGAMIDAIEATAGTAIADAELPAAAGGSGEISYERLRFTCWLVD